MCKICVLTLLALPPLAVFSQVAIECKGTIYVHPTDNARDIVWSDQSMHRNTEAYSASNGEDNCEKVKIAYSHSGKNHFAVTVCDTSTALGYDDWYLPSKNELGAIYENKDAIGGFTTNFYWSSTEANEEAAWRQSFFDGKKDDYHKYTKGEIRCVRRD